MAIPHRAAMWASSRREVAREDLEEFKAGDFSLAFGGVDPTQEWINRLKVEIEALDRLIELYESDNA